MDTQVSLAAEIVERAILLHTERTVDRARFSADSRLIEDLELDSLLYVAVSVELQRTTRVRLSEKVVGSWKTLGDIAACIPAT